MHSQKRRNWFRWSGVVFFMTTLAFGFYWIFKSNPLPRAANTMVYALRDGDGDALFDATIPEDRGCSDLTPAKLHQAWGILIAPLIANSQFRGADRTELEANQTQAVASLRYITKQGDPWTLEMIANQSEGGAKANVIYAMLATASLFDDDGHANPGITQALSLQGLHRYRARLESIGIHKVMLGPGSCVSWDQLQAKLTPKQTEAR